MKKINNFIQEKLKVNSKTKIKSNVFEEILICWGLDEDDNEINDVINNWIETNDVIDVQFVADKKVYDEVSEWFDNKTKKMYSCSPNDVKYCEHKQTKSTEIYAYKHPGEKLTIDATDDMICINGWYGTLYCVKK